MVARKEGRGEMGRKGAGDYEVLTSRYKDVPRM